MTTVEFADDLSLNAAIKVVGVGGGGGNAINHMIEWFIDGVEFISANTDAQVLAESKATAKVQLGKNLTKGRGAGCKPEIGREAAEESIEEIRKTLEGSEMVFITAGMGGGTGTGAAPVIAEISKELGALTVGVVTKPFSYEGKQKAKIAEEGLEKLRKVVDTAIIIPNDRVRKLAAKLPMHHMYQKVDEVLYNAVKGISDLICVRGYMNLDFADVRSVMHHMGTAIMGAGYGKGERRALDAVSMAISNPLLEDISISGAKGLLLNITAGEDFLMDEFDLISEEISKQVDEDALIKIGHVLDPKMEDTIRITVIATGIGSEERDSSVIDLHDQHVELELVRRERKAIAAAPKQCDPQQAVLPFSKPEAESGGRRGKKATLIAQDGFDKVDWSELDTPPFIRENAN